MSDRRGFIKSLFAAPVAVAAWATVAEAEALVPKELSRPNCLLAEQDEVWTLVDGTQLPVRRIEAKLDFEPAVTWEYPLTQEQMVMAGLIQGVRKEDGTYETGQYPLGSRMFTVQRRVFPRFTEKHLRADFSLQQAGMGPLDRAGQLVDLSDNPNITYKQLQADAAADRIAIVERDDDTPFDTVLRHRMTNCFLGWSQRTKTQAGPHGVFAVFNSPGETLYALGVCEFETTSANMLIQAPANRLFR